jgi:hypothetical protein
MREQRRDAYGRAAAVTVFLSVGAYAASELLMREFKS